MKELRELKGLQELRELKELNSLLARTAGTIVEWQMATEKQQLVISEVIKRLGLQVPSQIIPRIDAVDQDGRTYHIKYRTEKPSLSFDFKFETGELEAPFNFLIGVFINESGELIEAIRVRHVDIYDMANPDEKSLRLRWNDDIRCDPRVWRLNLSGCL